MVRRRQKTEAAAQASIVSWLDAALPDGSLVHHSPNEGRRHINFRAKLARLGTRWGWPDLELFVPRDAFLASNASPIFLEVKAPGGRVTASQQAIHRSLRELQCHVATVKSIEDSMSFLTPLVRLHLDGRADVLRQLEAAA